MDLGQRLRQVAVALVGHDHGRAGFGDQEVGAGDADIGGQELLAQHLARLVDQGARLLQRPVRSSVVWTFMKLSATSSLLRWTAGAMMWLGASLRSWMIYSPRSVSTGFQAVLFQVIVKLDLLGDHRLALGHDLRIDRAADFHNGFARFARGAAPVDLAAIGVTLFSNRSR